MTYLLCISFYSTILAYIFGTHMNHSNLDLQNIYSDIRLEIYQNLSA